MPARSVCLVALSLSEAGPGRFRRQASVMDIYHAMPCHAVETDSPDQIQPWFSQRCSGEQPRVAIFLAE